MPLGEIKLHSAFRFRGELPQRHHSSFAPLIREPRHHLVGEQVERGENLVAVVNALRDQQKALFDGNGLAGFDAQSSATLNLENCVASGNGTGVAVGLAGATTRVSNSVVTNNATGLAASGGSLLTRKNNMVEGNTTEGAFTGEITAK